MIFDWHYAVWVVSVLAAFVLFRVLFQGKAANLSSYERELEEIMTADKYKVKGRFEN